MAKKNKNIETFDYGALVAMLIIIALIIISIGRFGLFGMSVSNLFYYLTGPYYLIPLLSLVLVLFIKVFLKKRLSFPVWFYFGILVLNIAIMLLGAHLIYRDFEVFSFANIVEVSKNITNITGMEGNYGGGLIGMLLLLFCYKLIAKEGTIILLVFLFIIAAILIIPLGVYKTIIRYMKDTSNKAIDGIKKTTENFKEERIKRHNEKEDKSPKYIKSMDDINRIANKDDQVEYIKNTSKFSKDYFIKDIFNKDKVRKPKETIKETKKSEPKVEELPINSTTHIKRSKSYKLPPTSLLEPNNAKQTKINQQSAAIKGERLIAALSDFGINAELVNIYIGPSVTKFEVKPDYSINLNKITSLQNNLKMQLAARNIRIEAPIPGKSAVGVEIPNAEAMIVKMAELMKMVPSKKANNPLLFTLGKNVFGEPVYCELNKMPHLLIGGSTGSGKSVCINTIICSFLLRCHPDDIKLVLIDPKMVEFSAYHDVPHLLWPVITDTRMVGNILNRLIVIMEDRYHLFMEASVKNIESYNSYVDSYNSSLKEDEKPKERLPYIVVIIDELADLMAVAKNDVQMSIQRFTQKARAAGMHLIVATQRPSVDVITGVIKSNIPSRIAFAVASATDSRTILDSKGAEDLLGNGDMLYLPQGENATRVQGAFVSDNEISAITSFVKAQASPQYDDFYFAMERGSVDGAFSFEGEGGNTKDALYDEVVEYVKHEQKASTSLLQRRFGIGYNRAAKIIDSLEENGIIGPSNGSKPREVYLNPDD